MSSRIYRWSAASIIAVAALSLSVPAWAMARPDAWITTKTKISLLTTEGVPGIAINVDTTDGRVTLHGTVGSEQEKAQAAQVARAIEGVRDVRDLLQVVPEQAKAAMKVSDADLKAREVSKVKRDKS